MTTKTFLCHYGYGLVKKDFKFKDINRTKKDLNVSPFCAFQVSKFSKQTRSYPVYLESKTKIYMPKFYGLEHFGEPDQNILDPGITLDLFKVGVANTEKKLTGLFCKVCGCNMKIKARLDKSECPLDKWEE